MPFHSIPLAIIPSVALVGAGLVWLNNIHASNVRKRTKEITTSLPSFSSALPALELGMEYARRLEYKLAIIVLQEPDSAASKIAAANDEFYDREENGVLETRIVDVLRNTSILRKTLRMTDIVTYDKDRQFVVIMLPGIDNEHAAHTIQRIRKQLDMEPGNGVQIGCAEFPGDGLLLEDLIAGASSCIGQSEATAQIIN